MDLYRRTILVVEDEFLIRMALADALQDAGCVVLEASNVLEAVAILGKYDVDALITDVDMPGGLSGVDLVRHIRSYTSSIGILVTSGGHSLGDIDLSDGARFLAKPYRLADIVRVLSEIIAEQPAAPLPRRTVLG